MIFFALRWIWTSFVYRKLIYVSNINHEKRTSWWVRRTNLSKSNGWLPELPKLTRIGLWSVLIIKMCKSYHGRWGHSDEGQTSDNFQLLIDSWIWIRISHCTKSDKIWSKIHSTTVTTIQSNCQFSIVIFSGSREDPAKNGCLKLS